jgi:rubrerythrin
MDLGSIFLIIALVILVGLFISRPFWEHQAENLPLIERITRRQAEQDHSALLAERDRVLSALQELEFDHNLGKIPEEDYPTQRAALVTAGVETLKKLDAFTSRQSTPAAQLFTDRIDAGSREAGTAENDMIEAMISARRDARPERSAGFCPKCGKPLQKSDQFCPHCGTRIAK